MVPDSGGSVVGGLRPDPLSTALREAYWRQPALRPVWNPQPGDDMGILSWLIVGAIAGYVAGMFVKGDEQLGVLGHIVLGIVGAIVGGFIAGQLTNNNYFNSISIATIV